MYILYVCIYIRDKEDSDVTEILLEDIKVTMKITPLRILISGRLVGRSVGWLVGMLHIVYMYRNLCLSSSYNSFIQFFLDAKNFYN